MAIGSLGRELLLLVLNAPEKLRELNLARIVLVHLADHEKDLLRRGVLAQRLERRFELVL